jgi:predicted HicB family RNase H-like nuclease
MARPKTHQVKRVTTAVRLPEPLHERLTTEAERREVSTNLLITKAVENYLDHLVPVDEVLATR